MFLFPTISLFTVVGYALLLGIFTRGWKRLPEANSRTHHKSLPFVSVIVPFRNEIHNLPGLLRCLAQQSYSPHHLEVILVDDGSTDQGPDRIKEQLPNHSWLKLVSATGKGKKEALSTGISHSTGELIITTDADCRFEKKWIESISNIYLKHNSDFIVGPVTMIGGEAFSACFQKTDYLALQMTTAGAVGAGFPIICSGANLSFRKVAYLTVSQSITGKNHLSGDDVFLLHAMKKAGMKISYLKSHDALVKTTPEPSFKDFLFQRARWGGKSKAYKDSATIYTTLLVLLTNTFLPILMVYSFFNPHAVWFWITGMCIKTISDWQLLIQGKDFFSVPLKPTQFALFSLLYPFYIFAAAFRGIMTPVNWKGRKKPTG